jgi:hypothetical protein
VLLATAATGCATFLSFLPVEAPRFDVDAERGSVLTLDPVSLLSGRPVATLRIWTRVTNPNDFGLTLSRLQGDLFLEGREMAALNLPLGLPMAAVGDTVIPLDIQFGLPALGSLGALGESLLRRSAVGYRVDGVVGVDAGRLGEPTFGPRTWLEGDVEVRSSPD